MMDEKSKIFRKVSLERLGSPDRLDQLVKVTDTKAWIALLAFIGLSIVVIFWSVFGRIPTKVMGTAILIKTGGVTNVASPIAGQISDVAVIPGERVVRGQEIARIQQTDFLREISNLREKTKELENQVAREKEAREEVRKNLAGRLHSLTIRLEARERLLKEGLITKQVLEETREQIENIKQNLDQLRLTELKQINELAEQRRELEMKIQRYNSLTRINSPSDGRIIEVKVNPGSVVMAGGSIVSMEQIGEDIKDLETVIFVPALEGSKVRVGMSVDISPSVVKQEEYGTLRANVISVSHYPTTFENMMSILNNETLVRQILQGGPTVEVRANLVLNPKTPSGYEWTSALGPPIELHSGMLGTAAITIKRQRPINLAIPAVKHAVGVE